jgi:hypothetical protein
MFNKKKEEKQGKETKEIIKEESEKIGKKEDKEDIKEKISKGWLRVHLMFEIIGKPANYIEEILKKLLDLLEKEEKVIVLKKEQKPAKTYEETLFCAFAEVDLLIVNLKRMFHIIFDYMPSSVEVFEPPELKTKIADINLVLNELAGKLHQYDIALKKIHFQREILFKKLQELQKEKK